ncbi:MAG: ABC transporter substrate-binding protein [Nitrosomonadaceae bacterium]|nr:ABC transporter substrate-binding protein [Nitrosomonadaceae bacterium]
MFTRSAIACIATAVLVLASLSAVPADSKPFRWSSQGDAATLDPHSQNETLNNGLNNLVYEYLLTRDRKDFTRFTPGLALSWTKPTPTTWIFKLRSGVKFHDGTPFTADDVVFSFNRARESTVTFKLYSSQAGIPRKIDDHTVEFTTPVPNPVMLDTINNIMIMSKAWAEKNRVVKPLDYTKKEESFATRNAMGTGPFKLVSWEPGIKLVHQRNNEWWGIKAGISTGNVSSSEYRPITNAATRMAALKSGELDFVLDPSVQDVVRLKTDNTLKVWEGQEQRLIYVGFDQARDELLYSNVKGKNPFKDRRVRLAAYHAIDINALNKSVMRGLSVPTAIALASGPGAGVPASQDVRHPFDPVRARQLLAEAGYPKGFAFTMHCPNDRYVNDEKLCVAIAAMWAKIGLDVRVETMTKANFFPRVQKRDTTAFLAGWGGAAFDAIFTLKPIMRSRDGKGSGDSNYGDAKIPELDTLIDQIEGNMELVERQKQINQAVRIMHEQVHVIPLHRQVIPWVSRKNVTVLHRPNNLVDLHWVNVN